MKKKNNNNESPPNPNMNCLYVKGTKAGTKQEHSNETSFNFFSNTSTVVYSQEAQVVDEGQSTEFCVLLTCGYRIKITK